MGRNNEVVGSTQRPPGMRIAHSIGFEIRDTTTESVPGLVDFGISVAVATGMTVSVHNTWVALVGGESSEEVKRVLDRNGVYPELTDASEMLVEILFRHCGAGDEFRWDEAGISEFRREASLRCLGMIVADFASLHEGLDLEESMDAVRCALLVRPVLES